MEQLERFDADYAWEQIVTTVRFPNANLTATLMLLAIVVIAVSLIALILVLTVNRPAQKRREREQAELGYYLALLNAHDAGIAIAASPELIRRQAGGYRFLYWSGGVILVGLILLIAVGASSSASEVCVACHEVTPHSEAVGAGGFDPHVSVDCVRCHEASGPVGFVTLEVPQRIVHIVKGVRTDFIQPPYGSVTNSACLRCHEPVTTAITEDTVRGIRMSHEEPLDAGATCSNCHTLETGVVSRLTAGMTPCLRCHDGQNQPTTCSLCHTKDVSEATRAKNQASLKGRELVPVPDCGGCHDEAKSCDPCHGGQRMPHSELFMWWGHAREGVKDIWFNSGERCGRCHTAERRPCTQCHAFFPGHPTEFWASSHGNTENTGGCDSCHNLTAYTYGRDLCSLCHGEQVTQ
jgi:hypothetical protein